MNRILLGLVAFALFGFLGLVVLALPTQAGNEPLTVSKSAATVLDPDGQAVEPDGTIVYTVTVCDDGDTEAVEFFDQLPLGTRFQSSSSADFALSFDGTSSQVRGELGGALDGCASAFITVSVAEDATCGAELTNQVTATGFAGTVDIVGISDAVTTVVDCVEAPAPEPEPAPAQPSSPGGGGRAPIVGTGDGSLAD